MKRLNTLLALFVLLICSCKINHNIPSTDIPNHIQDNVISCFVDQNGSFYPNTWTSIFDEPPRNSRKYAYALATMNADTVNSFEQIWLEQLAERVKTANKVYILVHGYNNDDSTSKRNFDAIRQKIGSTNPKDLFIYFYWDGMLGSGVGQGKVWFNAAGYSQMAGQFGLRRVLNNIHDKEVIVISHSRGASVVLSSLSNPPYNPKFAQQTLQYHHLDVAKTSELNNNDNSIKCFFLAPAVGLIDFRTADYSPQDIRFRALNPQLKQVVITINKTDMVLKKVFAKMSDNFNATNLGYDKAVADALQEEYGFFVVKDYTGLKSHAFGDYINATDFSDILQLLSAP